MRAKQKRKTCARPVMACILLAALLISPTSATAQSAKPITDDQSIWVVAANGQSVTDAAIERSSQDPDFRQALLAQLADQSIGEPSRVAGPHSLDRNEILAELQASTSEPTDTSNTPPPIVDYQSSQGGGPSSSKVEAFGAADFPTSGAAEGDLSYWVGQPMTVLELYQVRFGRPTLTDRFELGMTFNPTLRDTASMAVFRPRNSLGGANFKSKKVAGHLFIDGSETQQHLTNIGTSSVTVYPRNQFLTKSNQKFGITVSSTLPDGAIFNVRNGTGYCGPQDEEPYKCYYGDPRRTPTTLQPGKVLPSGGSLTSLNGHYKVVMQTDGNLVQYQGGKALWQSGTFGRPGAYAAMQPDGNLVVYQAGLPRWQSGTTTVGNRFVVQGDSNIVIYDPWARPRWSRY